MLSLSQTCGHAIRALGCLANCPRPPAFIEDVAKCADVPQPYLAKIVKRLNDAGVLRSKRGYRGGIWLARPPEEITLLQLSEIIDGPDYFGRCLLGSDFCSDDRDCPTHAFWKAHREAIKTELRQTTIADVAAFNKQRGIHQFLSH